MDRAAFPPAARLIACQLLACGRIGQAACLTILLRSSRQARSLTHEDGAIRTMTPAERLPERLTDLELLFTHLERQVAELHEVILNQQRKIDLLEKQLRQMSAAAG
jgi:uncharacterized coiled-coil protein SlyX